MRFWDKVRALVDTVSPPDLHVAANDIHLNPNPAQLSARLAARLARLEAAVAAGDTRSDIVTEINRIKQGGA